MTPDSITEFWSKEESLFFQNKNYINRGISGQTTPQILVRFRADVIELKPKIVVILAGGNDIAGNTGLSDSKMITNNIFSMIESPKNTTRFLLGLVSKSFAFSCWYFAKYGQSCIGKLSLLVVNMT